MAENVTKRIIHISNFFLLLSLCALIVLSFIDVLPSKQSSFERLFYSCAAVFVISLCVDFCLIRLRFHGSNVIKLNKQLVVALLAFSTGFITGIFCVLKAFEQKVARQPEECCDCKEALTAAAIDTILIQVNAHELSNGTLPKIEQITPPFCTGRFQGGITDAYGHKMHCEIINGLFKVRSAGADGVFGTDDDITGLIVQVQMLNEKWKVLNSLLRCRLRFKINRRTAMRENRQLTKAKSEKNDEHYTQLADIENQVQV